MATDLVVAAIDKLAGLPRDLQAAARVVEARIVPSATSQAPAAEMSIEKR